MSKNVKYLVSGIYSAFSFSGKQTKITRRAKKYKAFSSSVSTNSKENLRSSISKISSSIVASL
jgi:hypothetical protein